MPSSGTVRIAGQDLFAVDEDARAAIRARRLGFVFQNFQLVGGMTALENVMLPLELAGAPRARQQASEMLARVGLAARLGHYPKLLSGGEQQRVALARAFVMRPLADIAPDYPLPGHGSARDLAEALGTDGIAPLTEAV